MPDTLSRFGIPVDGTERDEPERTWTEVPGGGSEMLPPDADGIEAIRARHTGEFDWESDCPDTVRLLAHLDALTAERDALAEDEQAGHESLRSLAAVAQEYFEASLPILNGYPLTDVEQRRASEHLRDANSALRTVLEMSE
jgi:hypothetical protein